MKSASEPTKHLNHSNNFSPKTSTQLLQSNWSKKIMIYFLTLGMSLLFFLPSKHTFSGPYSNVLQQHSSLLSLQTPNTISPVPTQVLVLQRYSAVPHRTIIRVAAMAFWVYRSVNVHIDVLVSVQVIFASLRSQAPWVDLKGVERAWGYSDCKVGYIEFGNYVVRWCCMMDGMLWWTGIPLRCDSIWSSV